MAQENDDLPDLTKFQVKPQKDDKTAVASVVDDELSKLGWSENARVSFLGDLGRENGWNRDVIFKGHTDPASYKNGRGKIANRGIISWNGERQTNLNNYLKQQGVLGKNDDDELRGMVRFMDSEMQGSPEWKSIHQAVRNPNISTYDASENLRKYIKYVPDGEYNSYDPNFRVKNNAVWAKKAKALGLGKLPDLSKYSNNDLPDLSNFALSAEPQPAQVGDVPQGQFDKKGNPFQPSPTVQGTQTVQTPQVGQKPLSFVDKTNGQQYLQMGDQSGLNQGEVRVRELSNDKGGIHIAKLTADGIQLIDRQPNMATAPPARKPGAVRQNAPNQPIVNPPATNQPNRILSPDELKKYEPNSQIQFNQGNQTGMTSAEELNKFSPNQFPTIDQNSKPDAPLTSEQMQALSDDQALKTNLERINKEVAEQQSADASGMSLENYRKARSIADKPIASTEFRIEIGKNDDIRKKIEDATRQQLSNYDLDAQDIEAAMAANPVKFGDGTRATDTMLETARKDGYLTHQVGAGLIRDAYRAKDARLKLEGTKHRVNARVERGENELDASLQEGLITPQQYQTAQNQLKQSEDEEAAAKAKFLEENPAPQSRPTGTSYDENFRDITQEVDQSSLARHQKSLDSIIEDYGSFKNYYQEQKELAEKYKYRPLARPLNFAQTLLKAPVKAAASVLKSVAIANELVNYAPDAIADYMNGNDNASKSSDAKSNPFYQAGEWLKKSVEDLNINKEYVKDFRKDLHPMVADTFGQLLVQIGAGIATGGAALPTLIGATAGAESAYDEADKAGAGKAAKLGAFLVGGAASIPDYFIEAPWFKGLSESGMSKFFGSLKTSMLARFGVKVGDKAAVELTEDFFHALEKNALNSALKQGLGAEQKSLLQKMGLAVGKIAKGTVFEGLQEPSEDKINDIYAYLTYDKSPDRLKKITNFTKENQASMLGGMVGGAFGGNIEVYMEGVDEHHVPDVIEELKNNIEDLHKNNIISPAEYQTAQGNLKALPEKFDEYLKKKYSKAPGSTTKITRPSQEQSSVNTEVSANIPDSNEAKSQDTESEIKLQSNEQVQSIVQDKPKIEENTPLKSNEIEVGSTVSTPKGDGKVTSVKGQKVIVDVGKSSPVLVKLPDVKLKEESTREFSPTQVNADSDISDSGLVNNSQNISQIPKEPTVKTAAEIVKDAGGLETKKEEKQFAKDIVEAKDGKEGSAASQAIHEVIEDYKPEEDKSDRKYSSTQVDFPEAEANEMRDFGKRLIKDGDLHEKGREDRPHFTATFGLVTKDAERLRPLIENIKPFKVKLGKTFIFENPDFDVVNVGIENSPELHALNEIISDNLRNKDTHPEFVPHAALAYVNAGEGKKYAGNSEMEGKEVWFNGLTFSGKDRNETFIPFGGKVDAAKINDTSVSQPKINDTLSPKSIIKPVSPSTDKMSEKVDNLSSSPNPEKSPVRQRTRELLKGLFKPKSAEEIARQKKIDKVADKKPRAPQSANPAKHSLSTFVRLSGGIQPSSVIDTKAIRNAKQGKFLVHSKGRNVEDAFRNAVEEGYFAGKNTQYSPYSSSVRGDSYDFTVDDFVEAVAADANGSQKHYSAENDFANQIEQELGVEDDVYDETERIARFLTKPEIVDVIKKLEKTGEVSEDEQREFYEIAKYESDISREQAAAVFAGAKESYSAEKLPGSQISDAITEGTTSGDKSSESHYADEIDESEPTDDDLDLSFDFADEDTSPQVSSTSNESTPQVSPTDNKNNKFPTDLFGNEILPTHQEGLFGKSELNNLENNKEAAETQELTDAYGKSTADYILKLEKSPDKDISRIARDLRDVRDLVQAKGADAQNIIEDTADALDIFTQAKTNKQTVEEVLNQPRLDAKAYGKTAEKYATAMENGTFSKVYKQDLSEAKTESILKKARNNADEAVMDTLLSEDDFSKILPRVESKVDTDGTVELNPYAHEIVRTGLAAIENTDRSDQPSIDGLFLGPEQVTQLNDFLDEAAEIARENADDTQTLEKLSNDIKLASEKNGTVIVKVFDEAVPHEKVHQQSYLGALNKALVNRYHDLKSLIEGTSQHSEIFRKALKGWGKTEGRKIDIATASDELIAQGAEEIFTFIATGDFKRLGISGDEADIIATSLAFRYAKARIEENPDLSIREALTTFDQTEAEQIARNLENILNEREKAHTEIASRERTNDDLFGSDNGRNERGRNDGSDDSSGARPAVKEGIRGSETSEIKTQSFNDAVSEVSEKVKNRQFAQTLREVGFDGVEDVPYIPDTEKQWIDGAQSIIETSKNDDYRSAEKAFFNNATSAPQKTALGIALIDHLGSIGEIDRMQKVAAETILHVGTAAQALRASQLAGKYDFATGVMIAQKAKAKTGQDLTNSELENIKQKLADVNKALEEKTVLEFANNELKEGLATAEKENKDLAKALEKAANSNDKAHLKAANLAAQVKYWKDKAAGIINKRSGNLSKPNAELYKEISAKRADLESILKDAFQGLPLKKVSENAVLKRVKSNLSDQVYDALVDLATLEILDHKSPEDVLKHLNSLTNDSLSEVELNDIHAEAFEATEGKQFTVKSKDNAKNRLANKKLARETRGNQNVKGQPDRFDLEAISIGNNEGFTTEEITGALILPTIRKFEAAGEWTNAMKAAYPQMSDADLKNTFARSYELRKKSLDSIKQTQLENKAKREGYAGDLKHLEYQIIHNGIAARRAKQSIESYYKKLSRGFWDKLGGAAMEIINIPKALSATGEISYIFRQGLLPLLTDTRAAIKGDWQGVGHGLQNDNELFKYLADKGGFESAKQYLTDHSLSVFIENIRQHPRFLEAQNDGVRFTQIGDFNIADDHFSTKALEHLPLYKRAEAAYTLPGDLQRLYMFDDWSKMIEGQNLTEDQSKRAKRYAAETINAFTGKGDVGKILAKGGILAKFLNTVMFSPQLLVSRFQSFNRLTTGFATAPKGMKLQMAKKGMRFYAILGLIGFLAGMSLDPDDDDFGKITPKEGGLFEKLAGKDSKDMHFDILGGMDVPIQLAFRTVGGMLKSLIKGDKAYFNDAMTANIRDFVIAKQGEPRFMRGKLSPTASLGVDIYQGKDYVGRPFSLWGGVTQRLTPMSWGQVYDAYLYDRYQAMHKEPQTLENAKANFNENDRKLANALIVMLGTFTGLGITQYPKDANSRAVQLASQLSDTVSKKDDETRRIEGGLRNLLKEKFELSQKQQDTRGVDREILKVTSKYPNLMKNFSKLNQQAKSENGMLDYYAGDLDLSELKRVRELAETDSEKKLLDKMIKSKERKAKK